MGSEMTRASADRHAEATGGPPARPRPRRRWRRSGPPPRRRTSPAVRARRRRAALRRRRNRSCAGRRPARSSPRTRPSVPARNRLPAGAGGDRKTGWSIIREVGKRNRASQGTHQKRRRLATVRGASIKKMVRGASTPTISTRWTRRAFVGSAVAATSSLARKCGRSSADELYPNY